MGGSINPLFSTSPFSARLTDTLLLKIRSFGPASRIFAAGSLHIFLRAPGEIK